MLLACSCAGSVRGSYKTSGCGGIWDLSFAGGSLIATFIQGLTVRPGGRVCKSRTANIRWRLSLVHAVCGALRHRALLGQRASRRLLASEEMRTPRFAYVARSIRFPFSASACWRFPGAFPRACLRLRAGRTPSNPASLDRLGRICSLFPALALSLPSVSLSQS